MTKRQMMMDCVKYVYETEERDWEEQMWAMHDDPKHDPYGHVWIKALTVMAGKTLAKNHVEWYKLRIERITLNQTKESRLTK